MSSSLYKTENAQSLGSGQLLPAVSVADLDFFKFLQGYRRSVIGSYRAYLPEDIESNISPVNMYVSPKIDGELWYMVIDEGEVFLVSPQGKVIIGFKGRG